MDAPIAAVRLHVRDLPARRFGEGRDRLGLPTVAMGLLAVVMAPAQAAALLVVPSLVTNVWQLASGRHSGRCCGGCGRCCSAFASAPGPGPASCRGRAGARDLGAGRRARRLRGGRAVRGPHRRCRRAAKRWLSPAVGIATGLVTAATGVFVIPAVPYLQALGLDKDELVQALRCVVHGLDGCAGGAAGACRRAAGPLAGASALAIVPALIGMALGQWLRGRVRAGSVPAVLLRRAAGAGRASRAAAVAVSGGRRGRRSLTRQSRVCDLRVIRPAT